MIQLLNFENFKKLQSIEESYSIPCEKTFNELLEEAQDNWETEHILNESFSSSIMKTIFDSEPDKTKWRDSLVKDFYKRFGVAVSDIQDTDFQLLTEPGLVFQRPIKGDDNKIAFLINDDTTFRDSWTEWQKKRAPFPILIGVVRGGVNVWYGFNKEPKGYGRTKQTKSDRYGVLSLDSYPKQDYFGRSPEILANPTVKAYVHYSTKAYVLDIAALQEKYSTAELKKTRVESRKGAIALMKTKDIKADNIARYKKILSEKVGPEDTLKKFQSIWSRASAGISAWISTTKLNDLDIVKDYASFNFDGWQRNGVGDSLRRLYDVYGNYIRDYVEMARYQRKSEDFAQAAETGINPDTKEKMSEEQIQSAARMAEMFLQGLKSYPVKLVEYNQQFDRLDKEMTAGIERLNALLDADKSKFNLD
jgi:hypothetical protein